MFAVTGITWHDLLMTDIKAEDCITKPKYAAVRGASSVGIRQTNPE
jgi:hypothetical protein